MQSPKTAFAALAVIFLFALVMAYFVSSAAGVTMSGHGWFALVLGTILTLGLTAGLFWLSFHSARSGHDDEIDL